MTILVGQALTGAGAGASAAECGDGSLSLPCPGLLPPTPPAPEPEPEPEPEPAPQPAPTPAPAPEPEPAPDDPVRAGEAVTRLLGLIDGDRRAAGLVGLTARAALAERAVVHSQEMADRGELWHDDDLFTASTKARLGVRLVGENVASNRSIDDAHRRLMASPGHRANLLSTSFAQVGVGVARAGDTWYLTEVFATPVAFPPGPPAPSVPSSATARAVAAGPGATAVVPPPAPSAPAAEHRIEVTLEVPATTTEPPARAAWPAPARRAPTGGSPYPPAVAVVAALLVVIVGTRTVRIAGRALVLPFRRVSAVWWRIQPWASPHLLRSPVAARLRPRRLGAR